MVLLHQSSPLLIEHGAVLNGVDAGADGGLDADGSLGVDHDFLAGAMGHGDGLGHLSFAELLDVEVGDGIHDAAGGHELDPVGAVLDVAANDVVDVIDGVGDVEAAGHCDIGREERAVAMAAGDGNATAGGDHARPKDEAALLGVAEGELRVVGGAFAGVAQVGEAVVEPEAQVVGAPESGLGDGGAEVLGPVLRGGVGERVAVDVDEAGENRIGREVGDSNALGRGVGDGLNAFAGDKDVGVGADLAGADVDELAGENGLSDSGRGGGLGANERSGENDGGNGEKRR